MVFCDVVQNRYSRNTRFYAITLVQYSSTHYRFCKTHQVFDLQNGAYNVFRFNEFCFLLSKNTCLCVLLQPKQIWMIFFFTRDSTHAVYVDRRGVCFFSSRITKWELWRNKIIEPFCAHKIWHRHNLNQLNI